MQERIVEIIVILLSELQLNQDMSQKANLTRQLILTGYTETEINLGFAWIFNHLRSQPREQVDEEIDFTDHLDEQYPDFENLVISPEAYGYLLQMIQLGVVKEKDIEMFVERAMAYGKDDINVDDLKSIVATILFGYDNRSSFNEFTFNLGDNPIQ